jgi:hypothetical protein
MPDAAQSVGIDIRRTRYWALVASGFCAALGGLYLSMGYLSIFQANMTAGRGFIALAVVYLGNRNPDRHADRGADLRHGVGAGRAVGHDGDPAAAHRDDPAHGDDCRAGHLQRAPRARINAAARRFQEQAEAAHGDEP